MQGQSSVQIQTKVKANLHFEKACILVFMHHLEMRDQGVDVYLGCSYRYSDSDGWLQNVQIRSY